MTTERAWIELRPGAIILRLHVQPRAGKRSVAGVINGRLKVRVTEPPADGRANAAVIHLVADLAAVPKSAVEVSHGAGGREKTLHIATAEPQATAARLRAAAGVHWI